MAEGDRFRTGHVTHPGRVRSDNEDSYLVQPEHGIWAVADGMGGHEAGAEASATVVRELGAIGTTTGGAEMLSQLERHVIAANARLLDISREVGGTVGSTLVVLLVDSSHFACVWSGDSRLYRIRGGAIEQISRDHSEAQDLIDRGLLSEEEARRWPRRNIITRALGVSAVPELDMEHGQIEPGDRFVLCSDGLTGHVADAEILEAAAAGEPQAACDSLLQLALERGGADNITVVVVEADAAGRTAG